MAKKLAPNGDGADDQGHELPNVAGRNAAIIDGFKKILATENAIAAAKEKHLDPLTKDRTRLWRNLKKDVNIERKDLELNYKLWRRAQEAREIEGDDGDRILDNLREVFEALEEGGQLDFLSSVEKSEPAGSEPANNVTPLH